MNISNCSILELGVLQHCEGDQGGSVNQDNADGASMDVTLQEEYPPSGARTVLLRNRTMDVLSFHCIPTNCKGRHRGLMPLVLDPPVVEHDRNGTDVVPGGDTCCRRYQSANPA